MTKEMRQKAIDYCVREIRRLRNAPALNGCCMTPEWQEMLDITEACKEALMAAHETPEDETNGGMIRRMADEELADAFCPGGICTYIQDNDRPFCEGRTTCDGCVEMWLGTNRRKGE